MRCHTQTRGMPAVAGCWTHGHAPRHENREEWLRSLSREEGARSQAHELTHQLPPLHFTQAPGGARAFTVWVKETATCVTEMFVSMLPSVWMHASGKRDLSISVSNCGWRGEQASAFPQRTGIASGPRAASRRRPGAGRVLRAETQGVPSRTKEAIQAGWQLFILRRALGGALRRKVHIRMARTEPMPS